MNERQFAGARWWKFDFHTHTPASVDFKDSVNPESWLKAFMEKGIDCVAITDHNSGGWIDELKRALKKVEEEKPDWYRPLYLYPGVEISAHGNTHILAIFGHDKDESHIDQLLGAVDYSGTKGNSDAVTTKSITEVADEIKKRNGIPIPAHADGKKGLFELQGTTLEQVLENQHICAIELCNGSIQKPQVYTNNKVKWTEVRGSDTHSFSDDAFGTFTWIKMDKPSIDGLELALIDGPVSVSRNMNIDRNEPPEFFIEQVEIGDAKHIGLTEPLNCQFSPFLTTIIGGRGSGKSSLLEFMRLVLRREKEIPDSLRDENSRYYNVGDENLLVENSRISLIYRKGAVRYRLNWFAKADDCPSLQEEKDGEWEVCPGEIKSLFPVYIYSQKQIFELAKNPRALIDIIDEAPQVDAAEFEEKHKSLVNRYKQIEGEQRELNEKIAQENRLRGESNYLARQIEQIETSGHEVVLRNYSKRSQQLNEIEGLEKNWAEMSRRLGALEDQITPPTFNKQHFSDETDILSVLVTANDQWHAIHHKLSALVQEAKSIIDNWNIEKNAAAWMKLINEDLDQYMSLSAEFEIHGIDPDRYPELLKQQKRIQTELVTIGEYKSRGEELKSKKQAECQQIEENRRALSEKRKEFLIGVLENNPSVSIKVKTFGENWEGVENEIRRILQCSDRFDRDFEDLKDIYYQNWNERIEKLKATIKSIRGGEKDAKDARFANHLKSLPQESMNDLELWFPGDDLKVTFGPKNQQIEQGSPGQKNAALLAFILSYGNEPLILDQPEDDLDNELIYDLIVKQLRKTKTDRQVVVVTHNANIVVNGDAEMVLPLKIEGDETHVQGAASIQDREVREAICDILEGGQQAFEERYKRIHLGD